MSTTHGTTFFPGYHTGVWEIDPAHSDVGFVVRHMMVSKVRGRFLSIKGSIITAENVTDSSAQVTIEMASISTGNERRDEHLRSNDFLDVTNFPTMDFTSTLGHFDGEDLTMDGELTIRGVTRPITLDVELGGFGTDSKGSPRMGFTATGTLNRQDFGITWNSSLDGGGVALSDKVQLVLEIAAVPKAI